MEDPCNLRDNVYMRDNVCA